ncbi:MAG TPA: phage tail sheath subtilisin-like domain-containing protein, partial [Chroococcidiopsis sp.]
TTYVLNTDYKFDAITGVLTRVVGGAITSTQQVKVTYTYADPSKVTASEIVGTIVSGDRTGLQAVLDVYPLRGETPKILIAPGWSDNATVAAELIVMAAKLDADCLIDAPVGATVAQAIAGRAGTAPVGVFGTSSQYATLCYPRVKDSDGLLQPLSQYLAGVIANTDRSRGYWFSPSNKDILGITGLEVRFDDEDLLDLNAAGIVTVKRDFATGFKTWGNRTALYPSDTTPLNFLCVRRTLAIFHESIRRGSEIYVDQPISDPLIEQIVSAGQSFIYEQVTLGALIEGSKIFYDKKLNPPSAIAAGQLKFSIVLAIPTPAEHVIYETSFDIELFANLGAE